MDTTTVILLLAGVAVAALIIGRLTRKLWPGVTVKSIEGAIKTEAHDLRAQAEADAVNAMTKVVAWVTDKSTEQAMIAAAQATMARKDAMRAHAAGLLSGTPPAP